MLSKSFNLHNQKILHLNKIRLKRKNPVIEVITTATSYPRDSYRNYKEAFQQLGCMELGHDFVGHER